MPNYYDFDYENDRYELINNPTHGHYIFDSDLNAFFEIILFNDKPCTYEEYIVCKYGEKKEVNQNEHKIWNYAS